MIIKIGKTEYYLTSISAYEPFIYCGYVNAWEFPDVWGDTCGDIINRVQIKSDVRGAFSDFTDRYSQVATYALCKSTVHSFYFDIETQKIYMHFAQTEGVSEIYNYEYSFGVCSQRLGVKYFDDFEYIPLVKETFDLEQQADAIGATRPSGMTGSITLDNHSMYDYDEGEKQGAFDFLLDGSIFGNDIEMYDDDLNQLGAFIVDDYEVSETETVLNIQDKRYE